MFYISTTLFLKKRYFLIRNIGGGRNFKESLKKLYIFPVEDFYFIVRGKYLHLIQSRACNLVTPAFPSLLMSETHWNCLVENSFMTNNQENTKKKSTSFAVLSICPYDFHLLLIFIYGKYYLHLVWKYAEKGHNSPWNH